MVEPHELPTAWPVWHFDFYRFDDPREWEDAGFRDMFAGTGLKLAEWPEKAAGLLPVPDLDMHIDADARRDPRRSALHAARRALGLELLRDEAARPAQGRQLVLLLGAAQIARGATIVAVRVWPAPEYTRVTIESDGVLASTQPPSHHAAAASAVDIEGIELEPALRELVAKVQAGRPLHRRHPRRRSTRPAWCAWWST